MKKTLLISKKQQHRAGPKLLKKFIITNFLAFFGCYLSIFHSWIRIQEGKWTRIQIHSPEKRVDMAVPLQRCPRTCPPCCELVTWTRGHFIDLKHNEKYNMVFQPRQGFIFYIENYVPPLPFGNHIFSPSANKLEVFSFITFSLQLAQILGNRYFPPLDLWVQQ